MSKIRKVKVLEGKSKEEAIKNNLNQDDLVIVTSEQSIEKIEGDPVSYLLKRASEKDMSVQDGEELAEKIGTEIDNLNRINPIKDSIHSFLDNYIVVSKAWLEDLDLPLGYNGAPSGAVLNWIKKELLGKGDKNT